MNKIVATLLLLLLASCGLQRFAPPLSYERRAQNARVLEAWYARCTYEDACLGARVTIPEALRPLVVVPAREMPRSSLFEDLSALRITPRGVELRLHNQASTDVPLVTGFEFPERAEPTLASDS